MTSVLWPREFDGRSLGIKRPVLFNDPGKSLVAWLLLKAVRDEVFVPVEI